jgi:hypothetical protein
MDNESLVGVAFVAFGGIVAGLMFLFGYLHGEGNSRFRVIIDLDKIVFPDLRNERLIKSADRIAFLICSFVSIIILIIGVFVYFRFFHIDKLLNLTSAWLLMAIVLSWFMRYVFIYVYRKRSSEDVPRIWPLK